MHLHFSDGTKARKRGGTNTATGTISTPPSHRDEFVQLRDSPPALAAHIDRVRYDTLGPANCSYHGGDSRSWQRYTRSLPVPLHVAVADSDATRLECRPLAPLKPATLYALTLLHTGVNGSDFLMLDDKLIVFSTAPAAAPVALLAPASVADAVADAFERRHLL